MNARLLQVLFLASALFLSGCLVKIEVDSTDGCVAVDGETRCSDVTLEFTDGDRHTVTAIPNGGFTFSHWKKGRKYLFGDPMSTDYPFADVAGPNACGAAYISAIDLAQRYHVGVTACFDAEGPDSRYSLAHEPGNNLGLVHDPGNDDRVARPMYSFGRGWSRWTGAEWLGSIMSYTGQRQLFSSPNNRATDESDGRVYRMGNGNTNAVKALNLVRLGYSQIRPKLPGTNPVINGPATTDKAGKTTPVISGGACSKGSGSKRFGLLCRFHGAVPPRRSPHLLPTSATGLWHAAVCSRCKRVYPAQAMLKVSSEGGQSPVNP